MNMRFYEKLPDYFPKKDEKMAAARAIIDVLCNEGLSCGDMEQVFDLVRSEISGFTAHMSIAELREMEHNRVAPASSGD